MLNIQSQGCASQVPTLGAASHKRQKARGIQKQPEQEAQRATITLFRYPTEMSPYPERRWPAIMG